MAMRGVLVAVAALAAHAATTEIWDGVSTSEDAGQRTCTLTIEKNDAGETTLMKLRGWGTAWNFARGDIHAVIDVVVTEDNISPDEVEEVSFEKTWMFPKWGWHYIAHEESKAKWSWDFSEWDLAHVTKIPARTVAYIAAKGDNEEVEAKLEFFFFGHVGVGSSKSIKCEQFTRRA